MKYLSLLICCLALIACEEEASDPTLSEQLIGTWAVTNAGQYASADCSGDLDYTGWTQAIAFGVSMEFVFNEGGTGSINSTFFGMTDGEAFSWDVDGGQVCIDGICQTPDISGDTFVITVSEDGYCEDDTGEEVDGMTMTSCEAAGYDWYLAACYEWTATKQ